MEFSCELWHSSLSKTNETDIERVQKSALKVILKNKYQDYESALKLLDMESIKERRSKLCLKFAKKMLISLFMPLNHQPKNQTRTTM